MNHCDNYLLKWDIPDLQELARENRLKKEENWFIKIIRDIQYKRWYKKNYGKK